MSSLLGLNAMPSTATRSRPATPPAASRARSITRSRRPRLIASTVRAGGDRATPRLAAVARNARMSLGRQPPPKPSPGGQEPAADALVVAEGLRERDHVGAGRVAHLRHRVDEGDLGGQEGVRRHLHQLGCLEIHDQRRDARREQAWRRPAQQRASAAARVTPKTRRSGLQACPGPRSPRAGTPGSRPGRPRSPAGPRSRTRASSWRAVPDRHRGLADDQAPARRCGASAPRPRLDDAGRPGHPGPAGCPRRGSGRRRTRPASASEVVKRSCPDRAVRSSASSPGSKNGTSPRCRPRDLLRIDVDGQDLMPEIRHADGVRKAEISGPDNGDGDGFPCAGRADRYPPLTRPG